MSRILNRLSREPFIILGFTVPVMNLAIGLGLHLNPTQLAAITVFVTSVSAMFGRSQVAPVNTLVRIDPPRQVAAPTGVFDHMDELAARRVPPPPPSDLAT